MRWVSLWHAPFPVSNGEHRARPGGAGAGEGKRGDGGVLDAGAGEIGDGDLRRLVRPGASPATIWPSSANRAVGRDQPGGDGVVQLAEPARLR